MREVEREVRINSLLQDLSLVSLANYDKVQATRKMVLGLAADVREEVKYGGIIFSAENAFCGVFAYSGHISIEFGDGAKLPDHFRCWKARENSGGISSALR